MKLVGTVYSFYGKFLIKSSSWVMWKGLCALCDIIHKFTKWSELNDFGGKRARSCMLELFILIFLVCALRGITHEQDKDKSTSWDHPVEHRPWDFPQLIFNSSETQFAWIYFHRLWQMQTAIYWLWNSNYCNRKGKTGARCFVGA